MRESGLRLPAWARVAGPPWLGMLALRQGDFSQARDGLQAALAMWPKRRRC